VHDVVGPSGFQVQGRPSFRANVLQAGHKQPGQWRRLGPLRAVVRWPAFHRFGLGRSLRTPLTLRRRQNGLWQQLTAKNGATKYAKSRGQIENSARAALRFDLHQISPTCTHSLATYPGDFPQNHNRLRAKAAGDGDLRHDTPARKHSCYQQRRDIRSASLARP
jgi:hypothetical protein